MFLEHLDTVIAFAVMMLLLSLIITTLVQMFAGFFNLRGKNLLWGTEQLFKQIDPRLADEARTLARRVLTHPALAHRPEKLATAMRSSELVLVLGQIVGSVPPSPDFMPGTLKALEELFQKKVAPDSAALVAKAQEVIESLTASFPSEKVQELRTAVMETFGKTNEMVIQVDAWFETVMDRTSERFKTWSRYITVGFALVFGLFLQIDSLALYKRLSTDEALRGRLLAMADSVSDDATKLMVAKDFASRTILEVREEPRFAAVKAKLVEVKSDLQTREEGGKWLAEKLAGATELDGFLEVYRERYPEVVKTRLGELQKTLSQLQDKVEKTTPGLLPDSLAWDKYGDPLAWVGMLMTVAFLSLGAPFWFNALRSLSALKPVLSQKLEEKKTG